MSLDALASTRNRVLKNTIVEKFIQLGANDFNLGLLFAVRGNQIEIAKMMLKLGASDIEPMIFEAIRYNHREVLFLLESVNKIFDELEAVNFKDAIYIATQNHQDEILKHLENLLREK